jgi:hypothetical protein
MILFKDSVPPYKVSISNLETTEKFGVRGSAAAMKHILGLSVIGESQEILQEQEHDFEDEEETEQNNYLEEELDLSDSSSIQSFDDIVDSDSDYHDEDIPSKVITKIPGIILDQAPKLRNTSSASMAASMMGIQRPIIPVSSQTEARVIQQLSQSVGTNPTQITSLYNSIAQASSSMMFKTPQHIESFLSMIATAPASTNSTQKAVRSSRGGDRKSKKFKESKKKN